MLKKKERKVSAESFYINGCFWATTRLKPHQRKISVSSALKRKTDSQIKILTNNEMWFHWCNDEKKWFHNIIDQTRK